MLFCSRDLNGITPSISFSATQTIIANARAFVHYFAGDEGIEPPTEVLETSVMPLN